MNIGQSKSERSPHETETWAIFLQYAERRNVLLTDGAWMSEASAGKPEAGTSMVLYKPRFFSTRKSADEYIRAKVGRNAYASRWTSR